MAMFPSIEVEDGLPVCPILWLANRSALSASTVLTGGDILPFLHVVWVFAFYCFQEGGRRGGGGRMLVYWWVPSCGWPTSAARQRLWAPDGFRLYLSTAFCIFLFHVNVVVVVVVVVFVVVVIMLC